MAVSWQANARDACAARWRRRPATRCWRACARSAFNPSRRRSRRRARASIARSTSPAFGEPVKQRDVVIFTRQLGTMIDAGLPIVQCLDILAQQTDEQEVARQDRASSRTTSRPASTFTDALRKHPKIFDDLFVNMVAAGEIGGILDTHPAPPGGLHGEGHEAEGKIKGAMIYPGDHHHRRRRRHRRSCCLRHPGVRRALLAASGRRCRRRRSSSSTCRNFTIAYFHYHHRRHHRGRRARSRHVVPDRTRALLASTRSLLAVAGLRRPDPQVRRSPASRARSSTLVSSGVPILDALHDHRHDRRQQGRRAGGARDPPEHQRGQLDRRAADRRARSSRRWSAR